MSRVKKRKVIISACLLGERCRYDGATKKETEIVETYKHDKVIPFCPEAPVMGVPRERISVRFKNGSYKVIGDESGEDFTQKIIDEVDNFIKNHSRIDRVVLKSKSPSCGLGTTPILDENGNLLRYGDGLAASRFKEKYDKIEILDENKDKDMLEVGSVAPEFCLPNQDDVEICLRDLKGKWIVLYFYPKDNTPGCTTQACAFTQAEPEFEELDAVILGVSADSTKKHRSFIEKKELGITLLSDESTQMMQKYGVWRLKKNYGKEYMGIVRTTFIINPEGIISEIWNNVRVKEHVAKVKQRLEELKSAK